MIAAALLRCEDVGTVVECSLTGAGIGFVLALTLVIVGATVCWLTIAMNGPRRTPASEVPPPPSE